MEWNYLPISWKDIDWWCILGVHMGGPNNPSLLSELKFRDDFNSLSLDCMVGWRFQSIFFSSRADAFSAVSYQCYFTHISYFNKIFHQLWGMLFCVVLAISIFSSFFFPFIETCLFLPDFWLLTIQNLPFKIPCFFFLSFFNTYLLYNLDLWVFWNIFTL